MNIFEDKKKRLILLASLLALAEVLSSSMPQNILIVFAQAVICWLILWTVYSLIRERVGRYGEQIKGVFARVIMRVFGPAVRKLLHSSSRRSNYVFGNDKREFLGNIASLRKGKKRSRKLQKIDIDACTENSAKIRLLYTKYILKAAKKGRDISYSQTPEEIKFNLQSDGGGALFDHYMTVRYSADDTVDNGAVELCDKITRDF